MAPATSLVDHFPTLHACFKLGDGKYVSTCFSSLALLTRRSGQSLFDVKFWPYPTEDDDPVFVVCGTYDVSGYMPTYFAARDAYAGRCSSVGPSKTAIRLSRFCGGLRPSLARMYDTPLLPCKTITANIVQQGELNSVVWTKDPVTDKPWLCVGGVKPKSIQIIDVESGSRIRSLVGHGGDVNHLAIHPNAPHILASVSADYTLRLWNLKSSYEAEPCVAIFAGEGHRQPVLWCAFHPNGRWIFTSGLDCAICLWAVPDLSEIDVALATDEMPPKPKTIYHPHFYSTEVHHNYVDCVQFYGDLVLSRCSLDQAANKKTPNYILLWKIDGFHSSMPEPDEPPIPEPEVYTRSSFPHDKKASRGFDRLLTFEMMQTSRFYLRFGFLHKTGMRPMLCMANEESKYCFWDLQKLEEGWDAKDEEAFAAKKSKGAPWRRKKGTATHAVNVVGKSIESELNALSHRVDEMRRAKSVASTEGTRKSLREG